MSEMELESQIKALKETAKYLNERIDQLEQKLGEKKEGFKLWEPDLDKPELFYYIDSYGKAVLQTNWGPYSDVHNAYKTREIAESEAKWLRAARKLRALARELNLDGWKYDKQAFYITLDAGELYTTVLDWSVGANCGQVLFHSREAAQTALDNLTEDEREVLFGN